MRDRVEKKCREEPVVPTITLSSRQYEAMVNDLTWMLQNGINRAIQLNNRRHRSEGNKANFKPSTPSFYGEKDLEAYLEWEKMMDFVFYYKYYTEERKVRKAVSTFRGHAITWWEQTAFTRRYFGESEITSWLEMKTEMKKRFAPSPYKGDVHTGLRRRSPGSKGDKGQSPIILPQQTPTGRKRDIRPLNQSYQPNQEELRHDSTCSRNLTQAGIYEKKNRLKSFRHEEDMQLTSRWTCRDPSVAIFGAKGVNNNLIKKVAASHPSLISKDLDLRSNPVKGGEDGVILESLNSRDVEDSIQQIQPGREGDIRPVNQSYQPNQKELSHDSTCSRNLTHEGITEKKNWLKSSSYEGDIQVTSRRTCQDPEKEQRLVNEVFRSNQDEPSCKSTCFGISTHHRFTENWNHVKIPYGLKVIQLLKQEMPGCPYLQAHGFEKLQTHTWRPGEAFYTFQKVPRHHRRAGIDHGQAKKMQWAFGKAHESDGSEEESKAREAKPPDGLGKESHAYEAKWICNSHMSQEEEAIKAHIFKAAQEKEAMGLWQGPVKSPPELKPIKRPFYIWCWTCTRKRCLDKAQNKAQFVGLMNSLMGFMFY